MHRVKRFGKNTFSSLAIRNYRLFFIGQAISLTGTWMQTIAQSWLVLQITHSGAALGIVTAFQFLPILFFAPIGGLIADKFPKYKILFFTQVISGILAVILGFLVATGEVRLWMIDVLAACLGIINSVDNPARNTFLSDLVGRENLKNAVSLNSSEVNLARIIGPAVAGILIANVGISLCFLLNGLSYLAVIVMLFFIRTNELYPSVPLKKTRGQLKEGFLYVNANPILKQSLIMIAIVGTLSYEFTVILPLFAQFTFHGDARTYAALTSAMGVGAVFGGLFIAGRKKITPSMLVITLFCFGGSILLASIMPTILFALFAMIIIGVFSINFVTLATTTLQLESSPQMRGRVMALWTVAFLGSTPIGSPIIGFIGEHFGPRWGLATGGFAAIFAGGLGMITMNTNRYKKITPSFDSLPIEIEKNGTIV